MPHAHRDKFFALMFFFLNEIRKKGLYLMRSLAISIFLLAVILASSDVPGHAKGLATGSDGPTLEDKTPEHLRYANEYKRKHNKSGGGGVGIGITIDPSILSKARKKKTVAPQKRPTTKKKTVAPQKHPTTEKKPAQKRVTATEPKPNNTCPERAYNLIGDADYWRERADQADAEADMAREAARGWRNLSNQAAEGAAYAKKAGLISSQKWHENFSAMLEQRAKDYEAQADKKENEARALRGMADEEDKNRTTHQMEWCEKYKKDPHTAFSSEMPTISLTSADKAQADARFKDRVAAAEKEKKAEDEAAERDRTAEAERDGGEYQEPDVMFLDKKLYTAKDMEEYVERWKTSPDQNDPVILGAGRGLGRDIMMLAQWRPDLAAALLNKLSDLKTDDLDGALRVVNLIRQQTLGALKIATEFGKPLESWGKAGMDRAVERMETTLQRQIRKETKRETPAFNNAKQTPPPPTDGQKADIPVAFTPAADGSCPERTFILKSDADYWRETADLADAEAAMKREAAKRWRATSAKAKEGAESEKKSGSTSSQEWYEKHAAKWEQRAKDDEATADKKEKEASALRSKADAEDKARAELEKERCKVREDLPRNAFSPPQPREVSDEPQNSPSSNPLTQPKNMCGPDITGNVFRVLDTMHRNWRSWKESKRNELCRDLINPLTSEGAWDIKALSPNTAPPSKKKYLETHTSLKNYEVDIQRRLYWFEGATAACAMPRWPCGPTVTFLGQCIHAQVVNYVQWGVMNKLCDQEGLAKSAHGARAALLSSDDVYDGQKIMTGLGSAYTAATHSGQLFEGPILGSDPGELQGRHDIFRSKMKEKLSELMEAPENSAFASRPAVNCSMSCQMTAAERAQLNRNIFGYDWGYGSKFGIGGR